MDKVTLALAKAYTDKQRIAYEESKSVTIKEDSIESPFTSNELIGLDVLSKNPNRVLLSTPEERPDIGPVLVQFGDGTMINISYHTHNGMLSAPCLIISTSMMDVWCPSFFKKDSLYDTLVYAFEEVNDTLGMGLTIAKGWHAVNSSTFANEPFDLNTHPFTIHSAIIEDGTKPGAEAYVNGLFILKETIKFTVEAENILDMSGYYGHSAFIVSPQHISDMDQYNPNLLFTTLLSAFVLQNSSGTWELNRSFIIDGYTTITYGNTIHPIDPKYLPKGGVGYTGMTKGEVTFDGNTSGKTLISSHQLGFHIDFTLAKVIDRVVELSEIDGITVCLSDEFTYINKSAFELYDNCGATIIHVEGMVLLAIIPESVASDINVEAGTYLAANELAYVANVQGIFVETVHTIDQKYIPPSLTALLEKSVKTLSWDGDTTNKEVVEVANLVKISNEFVDLNTVESMTISNLDGSYTETISKLDLVITEFDGLQIAEVAGDVDVMVAISTPMQFEAFSTGLYVLADELFVVKSVTYETESVNPKYLPKGGVGYTEMSNVTFNGDITGKATITSDMLNFGSGVTLVKVTDKVVGINEIIGLDVCVDEQIGYFPNSEFEISNSSGATIFSTEGLPLVISIPEVAASAIGAEAGTYVLADLSMFVSEIHGVTVETVHKIDPKFLPEGYGSGSVGGTGLPHIILNKTVVSFVDPVPVAEADMEAVNAVVRNVAASGIATPLILTFNASGMKATMVLSAIQDTESIAYCGNLAIGGSTLDVALEISLTSNHTLLTVNVQE